MLFVSMGNELTLSETVLSRFEEGKPADPTKDMSPEDAKKWREQTDAHKDEFKAASGKEAKLMSRQEKILKDYLASAGSRAATDYDALPSYVRDALSKVKDQETLWSDVNRWLSDNNNPHLRSASAPDVLEYGTKIRHGSIFLTAFKLKSAEEAPDFLQNLEREVRKSTKNTYWPRDNEVEKDSLLLVWWGHRRSQAEISYQGSGDDDDYNYEEVHYQLDSIDNGIQAAAKASGYHKTKRLEHSADVGKTASEVVAHSVNLERMVSGIEESAKQLRYSLDKYTSNPEKFAPQIENIWSATNHLHSTVRVLSRSMESLMHSYQLLNPPHPRLASKVVARFIEAEAQAQEESDTEQE